MPKKSIILLDDEESPWPGFLEEYFDDTISKVLFLQSSSELSRHLNRAAPDILFAKDELIPPALAGRLKAARQAKSEFKLFCLQDRKPPAGLLAYDAVFTGPSHFLAFQSGLVPHLSMPEKIHVLVMDDEPSIPAAIRDASRERTAPGFEIVHAPDGKKGLLVLDSSRPDVIVLDVKMPEMDGREVYAEICRRALGIPVIIFFDAIFGDEAIEIHKIGNPSIVEKGSHEGNAGNLLALIQKRVFFG